MYFSKILIMAFATGALGNKAPTLPQLTAVADAVAPAVSDAPVFRGRGANKPNSQGGDGGGIKDPVVKDGWMMEAIIAESDETNVGLGLEAKDGMEVGGVRGGRATAQRGEALHQGGNTHGQPNELHGSLNKAVEKSEPSATDFTNAKIKAIETGENPVAGQPPALHANIRGTAAAAAAAGTNDRDIGMVCASHSQCVSGYCTGNNSGQQGICVSVEEVESKAIEPNAWSERFNNINMAGCHNCYEERYAVGHPTFRSVVQGIPALELDVRTCGSNWVVGHNRCEETGRFHRLLVDYLSDIKKTLADDRYQFPIVVNIDFKNTRLSGRGGSRDGEQLNNLISREIGPHVFTKNDLAEYNGLAINADVGNPSWNRFRSLAATREDFWPRPIEDALRNKVIFVANHGSNKELSDTREFNNFFLAPSFTSDSEVTNEISGCPTPDKWLCPTRGPYVAEEQTVFANLKQDTGRCQGDLPRLLHAARLVSRCWDGSNPDTHNIPVEWDNRVSIGTNHDVEGQALQYKIQTFRDSTGDSAACGDDGDCSNGRCVYNLCSAGDHGDPCERDSDCDGLCGRNICSNGETGAACGDDDDCANDRCVHDICRDGDNGDVCERNSDCNSGRCDGGSCQSGPGRGRAGNNGDVCERDSDCNSDRCDRTCKSRLNGGHRCDENSDCISNNCRGNFWNRRCA